MKPLVWIIGFACALAQAFVQAAVPVTIPEHQLLKNTDHLLVAVVVEVDMVDESGRPVSNPNAKTGPGLTNTIRLIVQVDEVVLTNATSVPKRLAIPLDPFMHYSLGQVKAAHQGKQEPFLLLLKGPKFLPPFPGVFSRDLEQKIRLLEQLKALTPAQNRTALP